MRNFCEAAYKSHCLDYRDHVVLDERYQWQSKTVPLADGVRKACRILGWQLTINFEGVVGEIIRADLDVARNQA